MDEPMNGLDNQWVDDVRNILLKLKEEGKTIILASHNKEDIEILCDEVYEMDHGKLIWYCIFKGEAAEIFQTVSLQRNNKQIILKAGGGKVCWEIPIDALKYRR